MLRIRKEQMDHFARLSAKEFEERMTAHVLAVHPDVLSEMSEAELVERVAAGMKKAERHGITLEPDAARFILFLFAVGHDADERIAWVKEIVTDRGLDGEGKVTRLMEVYRSSLAPAQDGRPDGEASVELEVA
jgi:hypothetical protein